MLDSVEASAPRLRRQAAVLHATRQDVRTKPASRKAAVQVKWGAPRPDHRKKYAIAADAAAVAIQPPVRPWNQALNQAAARNSRKVSVSKNGRISSDSASAMATAARANTKA